MKNVTVTMDEAVLQRARIAAATEGKSLSKSIAETVERRIGRPMTQLKAIERFLGRIAAASPRQGRTGADARPDLRMIGYSSTSTSRLAR